MMPCFVKAELREGRIIATTDRGAVYDFSVNWEGHPEIRMLRAFGAPVRDEQTAQGEKNDDATR